MTPLNANCTLLNVRGKYYYAEEFGKFIEIEEWEYDRILNNPYLYYFSTALKKHFEWCAAVGKARTLTFSDALGQTHCVSGSPEGESVSPAEPNESSLETGNATRKPIAFFLSTLHETIEQSTMRVTKWTILAVAVAVLAASLASHKSGAPKHPADIVVAQSREIRPAIPVDPEIRKAIPVGPEIRRALPIEPEIRKAMPVQSTDSEVAQGPELNVRHAAEIAWLPENFGARPAVFASRPREGNLAEQQRKQEDGWRWEEIQLHEWDHYTTDGKTFMIGVFKERHLGDRRLEVDAIAKQIRARFYRIWDHHKLGNVEEVKVVFYK